MSLERRYQLVTGGRSFPKMSSALREVSEERGGTVPTAAVLPPQALLLMLAQGTPSSSCPKTCRWEWVTLLPRLWF